jgi:hypothetical protein
MVVRETRREVDNSKPRPTKVYAMSSVQHLVQRLRKLAKLPTTFTLDACRHGGMTELEEAELADGQGRALSAHKSRAYEGYAKRTMERALAATRKRHAHRLANDSGRMSSRLRFRMMVRTNRDSEIKHIEQNVIVAGAGGFEPPHGGIKIRCLTTWLRPSRTANCRSGGTILVETLPINVLAPSGVQI